MCAGKTGSFLANFWQNKKGSKERISETLAIPVEHIGIEPMTS